MMVDRDARHWKAFGREGAFIARLLEFVPAIINDGNAGTSMLICRQMTAALELVTNASCVCVIAARRPSVRVL